MRPSADPLGRSLSARRRRRLAVAMAVALLALGACSSGDADSGSQATTTGPSASTGSTTTTALPPDELAAGPSFGALNTDLAAEMNESEDDGPFFMLNLIGFRDQAEYADGRETDLTGEEANSAYTASGVQLLIEGGMRVAFFGSVVVDPAAPPEPAWDQVAIARYPSYADFFALTSAPEFQDGVEHKDAGVETSSVIVTHRVVDAPPADELPPAAAPVMLFELYSHEGTGTSDRPDSLVAYLDDLAPLATGNGGIALGTYEVLGTLIGDGREWDEAHVWWFPDQSDLDALLADAEFAELTMARDADLDDLYRLVLERVGVEPIGREP